MKHAAGMKSHCSDQKPHQGQTSTLNLGFETGLEFWRKVGPEFGPKSDPEVKAKWII